MSREAHVRLLRAVAWVTVAPASADFSRVYRALSSDGSRQVGLMSPFTTTDGGAECHLGRGGAGPAVGARGLLLWGRLVASSKGACA